MTKKTRDEYETTHDEMVDAENARRGVEEEYFAVKAKYEAAEAKSHAAYERWSKLDDEWAGGKGAVGAMTAIVSCPTSQAHDVGSLLAPDRHLFTRAVDDIGRTYILCSRALLQGTDLFQRSDLDIQFFPSTEAAMDFADHDVQRRREMR
jgi:hypothetical protein